MPRLHVVEPADAQGRAKELFDGPLKNKRLNIFKGLANSPAALDGYLAFSGALAKGELSAADRELIALAISEASGCAYCLAAHSAIGKGADLSEADMIGARKGTLASRPREDALVKFALRIHEKKGAISQADIDEFRAAGFGDGAITEVIANYALTIYTNYFNHVNDTTLDFPAAPVLS